MNLTTKKIDSLIQKNEKTKSKVGWDFMGKIMFRDKYSLISDYNDDDISKIVFRCFNFTDTKTPETMTEHKNPLTALKECYILSNNLGKTK